MLGSFGAPPAKFGVCVVALPLVIVTAMLAVEPTYVSGNESDVGDTVKSPDAALTGASAPATTPTAPATNATHNPTPRRR